MIQKAPRGKEDGARIKVELTQVASLIAGQEPNIRGANNPTVTAAKDELAFTEPAKCEDPQPPSSRITYGHVRDHVHMIAELRGVLVRQCGVDPLSWTLCPRSPERGGYRPCPKSPSLKRAPERARYESGMVGRPSTRAHAVRPSGSALALARS